MASASYDGTLKLWDLASSDKASNGGETTAPVAVVSPEGERHGGLGGEGGTRGGANRDGSGEGGWARDAQQVLVVSSLDGTIVSSTGSVYLFRQLICLRDS